MSGPNVFRGHIETTATKQSLPMTRLLRRVSNVLRLNPPRNDRTAMTQPQPIQLPEQSEPKERTGHAFRNLRELVDYVAGKSLPPLSAEEARVTDVLPFPFLAIVGQQEMKLALLLGLINPNVGGILLIGPRGTAKTTAVRSLLNLLPQVERSTCFYGCLPEDIEAGGIQAVCPDCARKYAEGTPLTAPDPVRLIELPLNAKIEDVIGGIDERAAAHERMRVRRGILAQADRNLLYIDEINLLSDDIVELDPGCRRTRIIYCAAGTHRRDLSCALRVDRFDEPGRGSTAPADSGSLRATRDRAWVGECRGTIGSLSPRAGLSGESASR